MIFEIWNVQGLSRKLQVIEEVNTIGEGISSVSLKPKEKVMILYEASLCC
jgi:hypothetical protein